MALLPASRHENKQLFGTAAATQAGVTVELGTAHAYALPLPAGSENRVLNGYTQKHTDFHHTGRNVALAEGQDRRSYSIDTN